MATKLDRLRTTLRHAHQTWAAEQRCQGRNATNESSWSVQVIEPVLAALDWPRLRQGDRGTGAYFEWPGKNAVDVALLIDGRPAAFLELKKHRAQCGLPYMLARLDKQPTLRGAKLAVAAWHEPGGFQLYAIGPSPALTPLHAVDLSAAANDPATLAVLAAPVLARRVDGVDAWLGLTAADDGPVVERFRPRAVQARFFELLREALAIGRPLEPRHRCAVRHPPTPTYAFVDLPGHFPSGWGLVFNIDPTVNDVQCSFFRNGNVEVENVGRWSFDGRDLDDAILRPFLDQRVLPRIERWKREAVAAGLPIGDSAP